jgi:hypothetical protein
MDQPTIYSETIREGVGRLAFDVRRSTFGDAPCGSTRVTRSRCCLY